MARAILDTSVLIRFWRSEQIQYRTDEKEIRVLAQVLSQRMDTRFIVSPVYIEMVAGVRSSLELSQTRIFLAEFVNLDNWQVLPADWQRAKQLAERIGRDGGPRHLGDCLIQAIANRFGYEVRSADRFFRRPG